MAIPIDILVTNKAMSVVIDDDEIAMFVFERGQMYFVPLDERRIELSTAHDVPTGDRIVVKMDYIQPNAKRVDDSKPASQPKPSSLIEHAGRVTRAGQVTTATVSSSPRPARPRLTANRSLTVIEEDLRDQVIDRIIKSWADYPTQDAVFTSQETHRIALDVLGNNDEHSVMQVAGVRAALTRGTYDDTHKDAKTTREQILRRRRLGAY